MDSNTGIKSEDTYNRILENLKERADRIAHNKINCIPFPFKRFSREIPGIEQSKYYLISANTKVKLN